jgi:hypothetical protein
MATAKQRKKVRSIGGWLKSKILPPSGKNPGSMDYPAIAEAKKARARRKKAMDDMFK